jgi:hypothetical protein
MIMDLLHSLGNITIKSIDVSIHICVGIIVVAMPLASLLSHQSLVSLASVIGCLKILDVNFHAFPKE